MKKENQQQQQGNVQSPVHNAVAAEVIPVAETAANSPLDSRVFSTRTSLVSQAAMATLSVFRVGVGRGVGAAQLDVGLALGRGRSVRIGYPVLAQLTGGVDQSRSAGEGVCFSGFRKRTKYW